MGVTRKIITKGNGTDRPKKGDSVTIEYTGNLYDEANSKNDFRGKQYVPATHSSHPQFTSHLKIYAEQHSSTFRFDTSKGRGPFKTEIGVGKVIKGTPHLEKIQENGH